MEGWLQLLRSLTDEELNRYGDIARDQRNKELGHWWAQALSVVGACVAFGCAVWAFIVGESVMLTLLVALVATVLGIWPYHKAKMRGLWDKHCKAVAKEQARRSKDGA